jgi:hypothetical protein
VIVDEQSSSVLRRDSGRTPASDTQAHFSATDAIVIAVVIAASLVRAVGSIGGYWFVDDWNLLYSVSHHFTVSTPFELYDGHFLPVLFLLMRAVQSVSRGSHATAVVFVACLSVIADLLLYALLRRIFGPRLVVALVVLWFAITPLTLVPAFWTTIAFYVLPFQIAFAGAVLVHLRYLERPTRGRLLAVAAMVAFALLTSEKAVILPFVLFAITSWFPAVTSSPVGLRPALHRYRQAWIAFGLVLAGYASIYFALSVSKSATDGAPGAFNLGFRIGDAIDLLGRLTSTFTTGIAGGPWTWTYAPPEAPRAASPLAGTIAALAVLIGLVVWTCLRRKIARRAWLCVAVLFLFDAALLSVTRLAEWGPTLGGHHRYVADLAVPLALFVSFALMPSLAEEEVDHRAPRRSVILAIALVLIGSTAVSYVGAFRDWSENPAKSYTENARRGFATVSAAGMLDQDLPATAQRTIPLFKPLNTSEVVLSIFAGHPRFRTSVEELFALDSHGFIRPARVVGWASAPGAAPGCPWLVSPNGGEVRLASGPYIWGWYVTLTYAAPKSFVANVSMGEKPVRVPFRAGSHDVTFFLVGGGERLEVDGVPRNTQLCVQNAAVGNLVPADPPRSSE